MTHLDTLRAIVARDTFRTYNTVDADLREEAGMDGNLARLLQSARDLDREATNHPPGSTLVGDRAPGRWFDFTLGFADDGPDLDTVCATLARLVGWTVHAEYASEDGLDRLIADVVVGGFECPDDSENGWPVFLVGHRYDETRLECDNDFRGEPVRIPLAGARITVY